jgi:hypothetical protein
LDFSPEYHRFTTNNKYSMATKKNKTKKSLVWNYLNTGKGITETIAKKRFNVKNLRATISDLVLTENVNVTTKKDQKTGETKYTKIK